MILYRILSFIVNIFCVLIAMAIIFGLLFFLKDPSNLWQAFLMAGVVLYGWFAKKFYASVLIGKQKMNKKQKDWLQVNAIVAIIFCVSNILDCIYVLYNPHVLDDLLKDVSLQNTNPSNLIADTAIGFLVLCTGMLVHIIWTYFLLRKNKAYFAE
jgi:hypothetical protein